MNHHMRGPDVEEFCCRKLHGMETGALCKKSQVLAYQDCREDTAVTVHAKTLQGRDSERRCKRQAKDGDKTKGKKIKTGKVSDLDRQAAKRHFIETMLQPGAGTACGKGDQSTYAFAGVFSPGGGRHPAESSQCAEIEKLQEMQTTEAS